MQFEEFDNKIREAADHHHPAYHEDAWEKMEKLLKKHMPEEKEKTPHGNALTLIRV